MLILRFCESCEESHWYDMCVVLDVVRFPELKEKLIDGDLEPFKCKTCGSPIHLENMVSFIYWAENWIGLVIPNVPLTSMEWIKNWAEYYLSELLPERGEPANDGVYL
jgi:hypothetical protein